MIIRNKMTIKSIQYLNVILLLVISLSCINTKNNKIVINEILLENNTNVSHYIKSIEKKDSNYFISIKYVNTSNTLVIIPKKFTEISLFTNSALINPYKDKLIALKRAYPISEFTTQSSLDQCEQSLNPEEFIPLQDSLILEYNIGSYHSQLEDLNLNEITAEIYVGKQLKLLCPKIWTGNATLYQLR